MMGRRDARITKLEALRTAAVQARRPFDREAWLNLAFYLNQQYVEWNQGSNNIQRIPRGENTRYAPRPVVNKIMHYVQQERALVLQAKPTPDVMPPTDDYQDISMAAVAKAYIMDLAEPTKNNFPRQLSRAVLWSLLCGDGYIKWVWDPFEKRPVCIPCSFFEVYPDPYAKEFGRARYIIHSQFLDVEQVYEGWGVKVPARGVEQADLQRTELLRGMGSAPVLSGVTVHELWQKPSRDNPRGQYAVWTNDQFLVEPGPLPYDHLYRLDTKRLPFTQIGCIERPDSQHFMSPVEYLRPAQMEFNKYRAQKIMGREAFVNYKWWIDTDIDMENLPDDSPRQILRGNGGPANKRPEILVPPPLPDNGDGQWLEQQMMNIVGLHEVSQAQVPGRVEAAKAIEMLKEADADRLSGMLDTISASISEGGLHQLMLAKQYVKSDVLVATYSREGVPEVKRFKAADIKDSVRVQVAMGTGLARSRAARQDQLMNLWQNQIITDPALMAELMEVPFPSFADPRARDKRLAMNENYVMAAGQAITPNSWDNQSIHIEEHNDYRKTQEFLALPEGAKLRFEAHCQLHEQMQEAQIAKQAQLQQALQPQTKPGSPSPTAGGPPA